MTVEAAEGLYSFLCASQTNTTIVALAIACFTVCIFKDCMFLALKFSTIISSVHHSCSIHMTGYECISTTSFAVMIVLQITQKTSRTSFSKVDTLPIRIAAPLSTNRAAKLPIFGEITMTLLKIFKSLKFQIIMNYLS